MPTRFTPGQKQELLALELFPEQVDRLEKDALLSISWRLRRPPKMMDVRERLADFSKALARAERLYVRISSAGNRAGAEASSRIYMAQEGLKLGVDALSDSLETATNIVSRAIQELPTARRSTKRDSAQFVRLILRSLYEGHGWHYRNQNKPMPAFRIEVRRKKPPFCRVAQVVSEASGQWSVDDAIRAYLKAESGKSRAR